MSAWVDMAPLGRMLAMGGLLAAVPLSWMWLRQRGASVQQRRVRLLSLLLFLTFDLVLFGAFTRLTDSGLGCPDWPGCYGHASPVGASDSIAAAEALLPTGPVTWGKAWVEMIHRYLATAVGGLILVLAVLSVAERQRLQRSPLWPLLTLFWVCVQGAFGAFTVTMKLFPAIVTLHLLGGMVLLALLRLQGEPAGLSVRTPTRRWLWLAYGLLWLQIALGGWVSTNYAVLACSDFPTCQGSWWPVMDLSGFEWWRPLGHSATGEPIPFAALTAIHYVHRLMAYAVLTVLGVLVWRVRRDEQGWSHARWLLWLIVWQLATGLSNVVLEWPLVAAVGHTGGAAALVVLLTGWLLRPGPTSAPSRSLFS